MSSCNLTLTREDLVYLEQITNRLDDQTGFGDEVDHLMRIHEFLKALPETEDGVVFIPLRTDIQLWFLNELFMPVISRNGIGGIEYVDGVWMNQMSGQPINVCPTKVSRLV